MSIISPKTMSQRIYLRLKIADQNTKNTVFNPGIKGLK